MRKPSRQKQNNPQAKGSIRIIAGKHRGRKLPVIFADGLRPTTDRVKETVFNWLMPYIQDSDCLDCFSGAGSLGFEAYSRGAKQVTFIELNKDAATQLKANKALLSASTTEVFNSDALKYLEQSPKAFNIVFIDPPFRQSLINNTLSLLNNGWLAQEAIIYLEMEKEARNISIPENWRLLKEKIAGQVAYRLYQAT